MIQRYRLTVPSFHRHAKSSTQRPLQSTGVVPFTSVGFGTHPCSLPQLCSLLIIGSLAILCCSSMTAQTRTAVPDVQKLKCSMQAPHLQERIAFPPFNSDRKQQISSYRSMKCLKWRSVSGRFVISWHFGNAFKKLEMYRKWGPVPQDTDVNLDRSKKFNFYSGSIKMQWKSDFLKCLFEISWIYVSSTEKRIHLTSQLSQDLFFIFQEYKSCSGLTYFSVC